MSGIKGYRPQSDDNIRAVNDNKRLEELVLSVFDALANWPDIDKRWLTIGRTHIEQGFMATNRAILQPQRIELSE